MLTIQMEVFIVYFFQNTINVIVIYVKMKMKIEKTRTKMKHTQSDYTILQFYMV